MISISFFFFFSPFLSLFLSPSSCFSLSLPPQAVSLDSLNALEVKSEAGSLTQTNKQTQTGNTTFVTQSVIS